MKLTQCIALQDGFKAVREHLEAQGFTEDSKRKYEKAFFDIANFYECGHFSDYSFAVCREYRNSLLTRFDSGNISRKEYVYFSRLSFMLDSYYAGESFSLHYSRGVRFRLRLDDYSQAFVDEFAAYLKGKVSDSSVQGYISLARSFFYFLHNTGIKEISSLKNEDIINFIIFSKESHPKSMNNVCCAVRKILDFLLTKGCVLSRDLTTCKASPTRRVIHPAIESEKLKIILETPDRSTVQGKRDYAILLLASFTGLRAVDIANLRFRNYEPMQLTIRLIQRKTGTQICLPIPQEAVNAIQDYTEHGRPKVDNDHIFLTLNRPYRRLSSGSSIRNILMRQLKNSSLGYTPHTGYGFHIFRRTIGSWLLGASVTPEMISQVLGHRDKEVLKRYLPLAPDSMRECALGFETVPLRSEVFK